MARQSGLVSEWACFPNAADAQPAFRRQWNGYAQHGGLLLAAGRNEATKPGRLDHIAVADSLPAGVMTSTTPIARLR